MWVSWDYIRLFRVGHDENDNVEIQPITRIAHVKLEDLVGYEIPKQKLIENTEAFVRGRKATTVCFLVMRVQVNPQVSRES